MKISGYDLLAYHKVCSIYFEAVRKVCKQCADAEFARRYEQFSSEFHTCRVTGDNHRHVNDYRLVFGNGEEVYVKGFVGHRMPLYFVKNGEVFLSVVQFQIDDVGIRSVGDVFQILCRHGKEDVLDTGAVNVARDESLFSDSFYYRLVACLADSAFQFNVFHLFVFENVLLSPFPDPIAPKALRLLGAAKIVKILLKANFLNECSTNSVVLNNMNSTNVR